MKFVNQRPVQNARGPTRSATSRHLRHETRLEPGCGIGDFVKRLTDMRSRKSEVRLRESKIEQEETLSGRGRAA